MSEPQKYDKLPLCRHKQLCRLQWGAKCTSDTLCRFQKHSKCKAKEQAP